MHQKGDQEQDEMDRCKSSHYPFKTAYRQRLLFRDVF
jgi:hypothetical protein